MAISSPTSRRIDPSEFAAIIGPALTLVAPSGMTREDRREWAHAAHSAIGDVAPEALRFAVAEAKLVADHPAKIIPAISKALKERRERQNQFKTYITVPPERDAAIAARQAVHRLTDQRDV